MLVSAEDLYENRKRFRSGKYLLDFLVDGPNDFDLQFM